MRSPLNSISPMITSIPPPAQVIIAVLSIQLGASFAVGIFASLSPLGTVFFRVAIAALLLCILIRPAFNKALFKHYKLLLLYGITLGMMNWFFYESIARIPLGIAVTIEFMGPLLVAAFSSKTRLDFLWIAIAVLGLLILSPSIGDDLDLLGVGYAVLAGIGWGGFVILSKKVNKTFDGSDGLVFGMIVASLFLSLFAVGDIPTVFNNSDLIFSLVFLAILSTTIPFYLEFTALKKLTPQTYGVLITLEPAAAAVIGMFVLGDVLGLAGLLAIVCVTIAAIGATITRVDG